MGLDTAINEIINEMFNTTFVGQDWIMYLIVIIASMIMVTRVWNHWEIIALPIMTGWKYFGLQIPTVFFVIGAILFVIGTLSTKVLSGALVGMEEIITKRGKLLSKSGREKAMLKGYKTEDIKENVRKKLEKIREAGSMKAYKEEKKRLKTEEELIKFAKKERARQEIKRSVRDNLTREKWEA